MSDLWNQRLAGEEPARSTSARLVRTVAVMVVLSAVIFLAITGGTLGVFVPNLHIRLTGSTATAGGPLRTEFDLGNDGRFSTRVDRIIVHSEAVGQSEVSVFSDGTEGDLPEVLDAGALLEVRILFDSYDCDAVADGSPKIDVRARPLFPSSVKRGLPVRNFSGHADQWLVVAAGDICGLGRGA